MSGEVWNAACRESGEKELQELLARVNKIHFNTKFVDWMIYRRRNKFGLRRNGVLTAPYPEYDSAIEAYLATKEKEKTDGKR